MIGLIINDEYIENHIHKDDDIWFRDETVEISNKFELLWKTVRYLTDKTMDSSLLKIIDSRDGTHCICSCNKCSKLYIIEDTDTKIKFAVGSSCIKKFDNHRLNIELYYLTKAKKCLNCNKPLVIKENYYIDVNAKQGDKHCVDCKYKRIYLNVSYEQKDNAKIYGALWDAINKKWYITKSNKNYNYLINKYK